MRVTLSAAMTIVYRDRRSSCPIGCPLPNTPLRICRRTAMTVTNIVDMDTSIVDIEIDATINRYFSHHYGDTAVMDGGLFVAHTRNEMPTYDVMRRRMANLCGQRVRCSPRPTTEGWQRPSSRSRIPLKILPTHRRIICRNQ